MWRHETSSLGRYSYQAILPLRTDNSDGTAILVDGVTPDHRATDVPQGAATR